MTISLHTCVSGRPAFNEAGPSKHLYTANLSDPSGPGLDSCLLTFPAIHVQYSSSRYSLRRLPIQIPPTRRWRTRAAERRPRKHSCPSKARNSEKLGGMGSVGQQFFAKNRGQRLGDQGTTARQAGAERSCTPRRVSPRVSQG